MKTIFKKNNIRSKIIRAIVASTLLFASIKDHAQCNANFNYTVGSAGSVNFASTSTGTSLATNHVWNFGDGNFGFGPNVAHTYTSNAIFNVSLQINDSLINCSSAYNATLAISNASATPCIANANFSLYKDSTINYTWYAYPVYPANVVSAIWSWGDATSTAGLYPTHTYSAAGMYNICLTVSVSCGSSTTTCINSNIFKTSSSSAAMINLNVMGGPTGVKANGKEELSVNLYPNPNAGEFNLEINDLRSKSIEIHVYNVIGEIVYSANHDTEGKSTVKQVNLNNMSNGSYFVKVKSDNGIYTKKIVINK